jgi:hypothetical protein
MTDCGWRGHGRRRIVAGAAMEEADGGLWPAQPRTRPVADKANGGLRLHDGDVLLLLRMGTGCLQAAATRQRPGADAA